MVTSKEKPFWEIPVPPDENPVQGNMWEQPAGEIKIGTLPEVLEDPEKVVEKTLAQIDFRGWCAWCCTQLGNEIIILITDGNVRGYPSGYAVYTLEELNRINDDASLKLIKSINHLKRKHGMILESMRDANKTEKPAIGRRMPEAR